MTKGDLHVRRVVPGQDPSLTKVVESLDIYGNLEGILSENRAFTHEVTENAGALVFSSPENIASPDNMLRWSREGVSGFSLKGNKIQVSILSRPMVSRDVRFLRCRGRRWEIPGASSMYQPLMSGDDYVTLPLLGGIQVNGEDLTQDPEKMEKLGLEIVKDDSGREVKYPVFVSGGRSILWPGNFILPAFLTDRNGHAFMDFDALKSLNVRKFGADSEAEYSRRIESWLRRAWTQDNRGLDWETYRSRQFEASYIGGIVEEYMKTSPPKSTFLTGIAVQYKGVGLYRYVYHAVRKNGDGSVELPEGDVLLQPSVEEEARRLEELDDVALAQRPGYEDKAGIFLDVNHEFFDKNPTGGIYSELKGVKRDAELMACGAVMSGVTMGYVPFLSKVQVDDVCGHPTRMISEGLVMAVRVILDDTHRLKILSKRDTKGGEPIVSFKLLMQRDHDGYSEEARGAYLDRLSGNVGHNLKVCLENNLTVADEQDTTDNMSIYGGIIDSQNFIDMENRYQTGGLIKTG